MKGVCMGCGMLVGESRTYHPYAACLMFRSAHNGNTVAANLRAVVQYGMECHAAGISLEKAMSDLTAKRRPARARKGTA